MKDKYSNRIRDPIHRFIHYSDNEQKIIDSRQFQRLRHLSQLALTYNIYPGAMHSRFEHSLGAMELATRFFEQIFRKDGEQLKRNFKKVGLNLDQAKQVLRLCALFHDIGHLPFSHAGEDILPPGKKHEHVGLEILKGEFGKLIVKEFSSEILNFVKQIINPDASQIIPELQISRKIISGNVDVDRTDYLIRDSYHCGVEYGKFDYTRLIESIRVVKSNYHGGLEPALDLGGVHTVEALILARYFMFTQVYYHRTRRLFDIYIARYLKLWNEAKGGKKKINSLIDVLDYDDIDVWHDIREDSNSKKKSKRQEFARYLDKRNKFHHFILETSEFATAKDLQKIERVSRNLKSQFPDYEFILDDPRPAKIHKFHTSVETQDYEDFPIIDRHGKVSSLFQKSQLIEKMPKEFWIIRIYSNVPTQLLKKVRDKAKREFDTLY